MKRILLVFTGGTIGSSVIDHTINTDSNNQFKLVSLYQQNYQRAAEVNFKIISPVEILSENLFPSIWAQIISAIEACDCNEFDGIVVTHGTDTLAYTACALSFYFSALPIPLVLVSSNLPLTDKHANGLDNFNTALEFIFQRQEQGVFVAYRNPDQAAHIHLGSRLMSCLPMSSDFISVQSKAYQEFNGVEFITLNQKTLSSVPVAPYLRLKAQFSSRILLIKPYPGLNYAQFNLQNVDAVLHDLYHSGTACVTNYWGEKHSLVNFILQCRSMNIPVYLAPAIYSPNAYSSTQEMLALGVKMIWNTSLEAAYVKLLLAYGNFDNPPERQNFINQNIAHEQLELN